MPINHLHHKSDTEWKTLIRQRVIDLHADNHLKNSQIKQLTDVFTSIIRRILKSEASRQALHSRSNRFSKINVRDVRRLVRAVTSSQNERRAFYIALTKELNIRAHSIIIRRALRKTDFRRCVACLKSLVFWANRCKRLKWAREHLHWTLKNWKRVIFSDESTFETRQRARQFVTKRSEEKYCSDCLSKFKHSSRQSVMIWRAICDTQTSELMKFKKTMKKVKRDKNKNLLKKFIIVRFVLVYSQVILVHFRLDIARTSKPHRPLY